MERRNPASGEFAGLLVIRAVSTFILSNGMVFQGASRNFLFSETLHYSAHPRWFTEALDQLAYGRGGQVCDGK
jgi:hypothetical protein